MADPIESIPYQRQNDKEEAAFALREEVRLSLEDEIAKTLEFKERNL